MEETKKEEGLLLHEWLEKKGTKIWKWYSAWVDRHPKITGTFISLCCFDSAYQIVTVPLHKHSIPIMNNFCASMFVLIGFVFIYVTFIYKPKTEVK